MMEYKLKQTKRSSLRSQLIQYRIERKVEEMIEEDEYADRCIACGEIIPEGRQICIKCERSAES